MLVNLIDYGAINMPKRAHAQDAGADVFSPSHAVVWPGEKVNISLGFGIEVPEGYAAYIEARGSTGNSGLLPVSNPIDVGYTGEVHAVLWNVSKEPVRIYPHDRIAQLVIRKILTPDFAVISKEAATPTVRGTNCYGSTGK